MRDVFLKLIAFGIFGLGMEVVFTGILDRLWKNKVFVGHMADNLYLLGYSSPWYIPLYAMALLFLWLFYDDISSWWWPFRGLLYASLCHFVEYWGMWLMRKILGKSPSEENYRQSPFSINGLTRLDFFPIFFVAGFCFEWLYLHIR